MTALRNLVLTQTDLATVRDAAQILAYSLTAPVTDKSQPDLFDTGADQACDEFMIERDELKAQIAMMDEVISNQARTLLGQRRAIDEIEQTLVGASGFMTDVQAKLNALGIRFQGGNEDGSATILVNAEALIRFAGTL